MTIESDKPMKKCPYCYKDVRNLGLHIINNHPTLLNQLEEGNSETQSSPVTANISPNYVNTPQKLPVGDINSMVRDKLETMLNIKLIQMLEKGATIEEIQRMQTPPPPPQSSGLDDIKKLVEIQRLISPHAPMIAEEAASSFDWGGLISAAMPILSQMLASRNKNNMESEENGFNTGGFEETGTRLLKPISEEITGDRAESSGFSEEPRTFSEPKQ